MGEEEREEGEKGGEEGGGELSKQTLRSRYVKP